jgi:pyridoxal 5'-phosphate synthase pdxT subunit
VNPRIGILALQGDVREHSSALEDVGALALPVRRAEELDSLDGLIIPGGESTAMWKLAVAFDLLEPLRKKIASGLPTYGSCAGMIMMADRVNDAIDGQQTIGGLDITVRRNAFGRQVDSFETDLDLQILAGAPFHAIFIRAPWVEEIGSGVEPLGEVALPDGGSRIVAVRQGHLLATSFHPELSGDVRIHRYFVDQICS